MDSLLSKRFQRPGKLDKYVRHDLRIWESDYGRQPRPRDDDGKPMVGDQLLADWRSRSSRGAARLRAYYDVLPARESRLTLDSSRTNQWGDPMFRIDLADSPASAVLRKHTENEIRGVFDRIVGAGGGKILATQASDLQDHPGGGCRMGTDPETSVVDPQGRSHDHPNLWVVGAPTMVSGGCNNGTLTFCALSLRTAAHLGRELPRRASLEPLVPHRVEVA
jgi:quinoprotein glucose dehydrogenase